MSNELNKSHEEMVAALIKSGEEIHASLTPEKCEMIHQYTLAFAAAGKCVDLMKKHVIYNKPAPNQDEIDDYMEEMEAVSDSYKGGFIMNMLNPENCNVMHAAIGIFSEAGELAEAVLEMLHGKPLDMENVVEELGDLEFYMQQKRAALGISRERTQEANMDKLARRYPGYKYTDQRAHERADKQ